MGKHIEWKFICEDSEELTYIFPGVFESVWMNYKLMSFQNLYCEMKKMRFSWNWWKIFSQYPSVLKSILCPFWSLMKLKNLLTTEFQHLLDKIEKPSCLGLTDWEVNDKKSQRAEKSLNTYYF